MLPIHCLNDWSSEKTYQMRERFGISYIHIWFLIFLSLSLCRQMQWIHKNLEERERARQLLMGQWMPQSKDGGNGGLFQPTKPNSNIIISHLSPLTPHQKCRPFCFTKIPPKTLSYFDSSNLRVYILKVICKKLLMEYFSIEKILLLRSSTEH